MYLISDADGIGGPLAADAALTDKATSAIARTNCLITKKALRVRGKRLTCKRRSS